MKLNGLLIALLIVAPATVIAAGQASSTTAATPAVLLKTAVTRELVRGEIEEAARAYRDIATRFRTSHPEVAAQALIRLAETYERRSNPSARNVYQELARDFGTRREGALARAKLVPPSGIRLQSALAPRLWRNGPLFPLSFSADSRYGLYVTNEMAARTLVVDLTSNAERTIFQPEGRAAGRWPVMSPDGLRIAFSLLTRGPQGTGTGTDSLHVIGTEPGATARKVTVASSDDLLIPVAWSANSTAVLVKRAVGGGWGSAGGSLAWVSAADGSLRTIKSFEAWRSVIAGGFQGPTGVRLSPDGSAIAYMAEVSDGSPDRYIFTIDADGGNEHAVVTMAGRNTHPTWAPGGSHLLFVNDSGGQRTLWAVRMNGGAASGQPFIVQANFQGTLVDMTRGGDLFYLTSNMDFPFSEYVVQRQPSGSAALQPFSGMSGTWSSTNRLAFFRSLQRDLIIRSLDSGEERTFRHDGLTNVSPRWLRDGSALITYVDASENDDEGGSFYRLDVASGTFARLFARDTAAHRRSSVTALSPDDRTLYAVVRATSRGAWTGLVGIDVATGEERPVVSFPGPGLPGRSEPSLAVSPDGSTIAIRAWVDDVGTAAQVITVNANGTNYRAVHGPFDGGGWADILRWAPDGQSLLTPVAGTTPDVRWRMMRVPVGGGTPVFDGLDSTHLPPQTVTSSFDVSPDGSRVAVSGRSPISYELWSLDGVLSFLNAR